MSRTRFRYLVYLGCFGGTLLARVAFVSLLLDLRPCFLALGLVLVFVSFACLLACPPRCLPLSFLFSFLVGFCCLGFRWLVPPSYFHKTVCAPLYCIVCMYTFCLYCTACLRLLLVSFVFFCLRVYPKRAVVVQDG